MTKGNSKISRSPNRSTVKNEGVAEARNFELDQWFIAMNTCKKGCMNKDCTAGHTGASDDPTMKNK